MLTRFEPPSQPLPFQFGTPEQFAELRAMLARVGYREAEVYPRITAQHEWELTDASPGPRRYKDTLGVLIDLFRGFDVPRQVVESFIRGRDAQLLSDFTLVAPTATDPDTMHATVLLYPTESFVVASDLNQTVEQTAAPADVVYPAITRSTQHFLRLMPRVPCERFLELCSGTGIGAMVASRFAEHAWAVDITDRATRFAQFNLELNGIRNVTALRGDLYEPVHERTFDFIVAHPPYVPNPQQEYIFRDGGDDGEQITRRILAGLPEHLEPGGRFYCTCMATDRLHAPVEARVREMLGARASEFDVAVLQRFTLEPEEYYGQTVLSAQVTREEGLKRAAALKRLEVERFVYSTIVVQRRREERPVFTARHRLAAGTDAGAIDWLMRWRAMGARPELSLIEARPRSVAGTEIRVTHRSRGGAWRAEGCLVATEYPFAVQADCALWVPQFISACDGTRTLGDHLRELKAAGAVSEDTTEQTFLEYVRRFLDHGLLEIDACRVPATGDEA